MLKEYHAEVKEQLWKENQGCWMSLWRAFYGTYNKTSQLSTRLAKIIIVQL